MHAHLSAGLTHKRRTNNISQRHSAFQLDDTYLKGPIISGEQKCAIKANIFYLSNVHAI